VLQPTERIGYAALLRVLLRDHPKRAGYGASLMITQSFLYNAIFFTYALVLGTTSPQGVVAADPAAATRGTARLCSEARTGASG